MAELALAGLSKRYADHLAVDGVDLRVASGEFISLLGPSGCGKSTLLRMIAGLIEPTAGQILLGGADITRVPAHRRGLGLVFQSYALFPHLSVAGNVAYGLRRRGVRGAELKQQVDAALALVRLGHLADRMPRQLSGGQQQRVALARAVAPRPRLLLLDEPLSQPGRPVAGRDADRDQATAAGNWESPASSSPTTKPRRLSLSDRICVLAGGRVQQVGTPETVYTRPANGFVAGFIGRSNRLRGRVEAADAAGSLLRLEDGSELRSNRTEPGAGATVDIIIRNDAIGLVAAPAGSVSGGLHGRVILRSFAGTQVQTRCSSRHRGRNRDRGIHRLAAGWPTRRGGGDRAGRSRRRVHCPRSLTVAQEATPARTAGILLITPLGLLLLLVFVAPILLMLPTSFRIYQPGFGMRPGWTLDNYTQIFTDSYFLEVLGRTFVMGLSVTAICAVLGYPLAMVLARSTGFARSCLTLLIVFPLTLNLVVRSFGWIALLSNRGLLNQWLMALGLTTSPLRMMFQSHRPDRRAHPYLPAIHGDGADRLAAGAAA